MAALRHPGINVNEVGNTYLDGTAPGEVSLYTNDFFGVGTLHGIDVLAELYSNSDITPGSQVYAAIQTAFKNYIPYLSCSGYLTKSDGTRAQNPGSSSCMDTCTNCKGTGPVRPSTQEAPR